MKKELRCKLRPMNMIDILDEAFELLKTSLGLLIGIPLVIYIPLVMIIGILLLIDTKKMIVFSFYGMPILLILFLPILTATLTLAISDRYLDREITIAESYKRILKFKMFIRVMLANFLKYIIISSPLLVFFSMVSLLKINLNPNNFPYPFFSHLKYLFFLSFPVAYFFIRLLFVDHAVVLENMSVFSSIKRSWILTKKEVFKIFTVLLVTNIIYFIISYAFSIPSTLFGMIPNIIDGIEFIMIISNAIPTIIALILLSIFIILLYYDIRITKEGFDLEMLASMIDEKNNNTTNTHINKKSDIDFTDSNEPNS